ncbi:ribonuclease M5 [Heliophilum fasciatum]|uniref:Ribonuclease M5 n=1 Tax=Heliophilum fasciatum TaxID=35700 RepID=A0A4R2RZY8_9FIRM|nr:ribonuclease M5 [Heliophilum fasciatum]MCW2277007.1 ribonuclease M5 [Heliophilum fasciatum]TCP68467.1 RNAse M5 [Heliophilum fasciatum]
MNGKEKIHELIVVEGRDDLVAVKRAVDAAVVITQGLGLSDKTLATIRAAQERCGVIVLTDPDGPGERIRRWVTEAVPGVRHAFMPRAQARNGRGVGVEYASPEAIRQALQAARSPQARHAVQEVFTKADLWNWGLDGAPGAGARREQVGERLGIGRTNAKQFLQRINHFGLSRQEIEAALAAEQQETRHEQ